MPAGPLAGLHADALAVYRAALAAVHGRRVVARACTGMTGDWAAVAIGKAADAMLAGAADTLGLALNDSLAITAAEYRDPGTRLPPRCELVLSAHPRPDRRSLDAGERLVEFVSAHRKILFLLSGGSSAMVERLPPRVDLDALTTLNDWLLASGRPIDEINAVRRAVSTLKGGRLLQHLEPSKCRLLIISDVPGDEPALVGSGPLTAAKTALPGGLPDWVRSMCAPQPPDVGAMPTEVVAGPEDALAAAAQEASTLGYRVRCRARDLGDDIERVAAHIADGTGAGAWLHSGEPQIRLPASPGLGGRCQHLALLIAERIAGSDETVVLCAGTDGLDGAGAAGAVVDGQTIVKGESRGADLRQALTSANAGKFLAAAGVLLPAFASGTNVTDLVVKIKAPAA